MKVKSALEVYKKKQELKKIIQQQNKISKKNYSIKKEQVSIRAIEQNGKHVWENVTKSDWDLKVSNLVNLPVKPLKKKKKSLKLKSDQKKMISNNLVQQINVKNASTNCQGISKSIKKNALNKGKAVLKSNGKNTSTQGKFDPESNGKHSSNNGKIVPQVNGKNASIKSKVQSKSSQQKKKLDSQKTHQSFILSSKEDSVKVGIKNFNWMLQTMDPNIFFRDYWEKKPLLIQNNGKKNGYSQLFSSQVLHEIMAENDVYFTRNLDVTSYTDGKRTTHNPEGRAFPPIVWDFYNNGCSVRLLNPQTFCHPVYKLLANLQELFGSFCGANVYLTPPGTQGFAPHWDDIEAFILQLEGKKHWRVYAPRVPNEKLPRFSSGNFGPDTELGSPVIDCVLEAGDLLYFPRGYIHQGNALDDRHSLHITISTYQKTAWIDLLEKIMPKALEAASSNRIELREGLPIGYWQQFGLVTGKKDTSTVQKMRNKLKSIFNVILDELPLDDAVDQMSKGFLQDALPPCLTSVDEDCSVYGDGEYWNPELKRPVHRVELAPDTRIRLLRRNCLRVVQENEGPTLYFSVNNSLEYHEREPESLALDSSSLAVVEALVQAYPNYIPVEKLPVTGLLEQISSASALWEKGLIVTEGPLEAFDDDEM